ncbi:MAG: hypothetical protein ACK40O_06090 [Allosphingosinicella sp.]
MSEQVLLITAAGVSGGLVTAAAAIVAARAHLQLERIAAAFKSLVGPEAD